MNNNNTFHNAKHFNEKEPDNNNYKNAYQNNIEKLIPYKAKKYIKKRRVTEIISYILDKIADDQKSINLLYDLLNLLNYNMFNTNIKNSDKLDFIKKYINNSIKELNTISNLSNIDSKYRIIIQIFKSVYRIKFNESNNQKYLEEKKKLLKLINIENNLIENTSRKALSGSNLRNAKINTIYANNKIFNPENNEFNPENNSRLAPINKLITYTSILSNPPPNNNMEGFHNFTIIEYFIYNKKLCGELTNYNDLVSYSPFYYSNGLFHINPLAKDYYLENRS